MSVELRLSSVDPPAEEPHRTVYRDIVNLPDPVQLGLTVRYFNHDNVGLYMQITGSAVGYTFGTVNLGLLGSGASANINLDQFASRAKPVPGNLPNGEMQENVTLTLKGYTDSGYTTLKWTFTRTVTVYWINSADAAFTVDVLNNFDDGTVQGWTSPNTIAVATDYVLSAPYSLKVSTTAGGSQQGKLITTSKNITTPNKTKVFAIIDIRISRTSNGNCQVIQVLEGTTLKVRLGTDASIADNVPINKWMRIVIPMTANAAVTINIELYAYSNSTSFYVWVDDFKQISK